MEDEIISVQDTLQEFTTNEGTSFGHWTVHMDFWLLFQKGGGFWSLFVKSWERTWDVSGDAHPLGVDVPICFVKTSGAETVSGWNEKKSMNRKR